MNVHILVAIIAFLGTIIGGTLVTAGNYFLTLTRERGELKMAARLIASELQQNFLTVEFALKQERWWQPHEELSTEAWKQYKHLLASKLAHDTWSDLVFATTQVNQAIAMCAALRPPNQPDYFKENVPAITHLVESMKKGYVSLAPYLL